jgi:hypothetical protein
MREHIEKIFDDFVRTKLAKRPEVADFILAHSGRPSCIDKIFEQVRLCEINNIGGVFDQEKYREVIELGADLFAYVALEVHGRNLISRAEKRRREDEVNRMSELEAEFSEYEAEATTTKLISRPGGVAN